MAYVQTACSFIQTTTHTHTHTTRTHTHTHTHTHTMSQPLYGLIRYEMVQPAEDIPAQTQTQTQTHTQTQAHVNPFATIPIPSSTPTSISACALTRVHVDAHIESYNATIHVMQTYQNNSVSWCKAEYVFPLDEGAAVRARDCLMRVNIGRVMQCFAKIL